MSIADRLWGKRSYDEKRHLSHVQQLHAKYPLNTHEKCNAFVLEIIKDVYPKDKIPWLIIEEVETLLIHLFDENKIFRPDIPTIEDRDILQVQELELSSTDRIQQARSAITKFLRVFPLPQSAYQKEASPGSTVPLSALLTNLAQHVEHAIHICMNTKYGEHRVFSSTAHDFSENTHALSGAEMGSSRKLIMPSDYKGDPTDYLRGTPFAEFFSLPIPFAIPRTFYPEHTLIIAASGSGKTQYLQNVVLNFLQEPDPPGMFILDSQDDEKGILHKLANLDVFHPDHGRLKDRLVILSPEDKPALNLFAFQGEGPEIDELFAYLMGAIDRDLTAKMSTASAYILRLLRKLSNPTIYTFKDILENPKKHESAIALLDQTSQDFFNNQFGVKAEMGATRLQVASHLYSILANTAFTDMFAAEQNRFDAFDAMQKKKIVLVNTSERKLTSAGTKIYGRYMVAQVMAAAMKRGDIPGNRDLTLLMLDEAHEYFDEQTEKILRQARKFNVGLVAATQMYDQIEPKVKAALATNTSTKIIGRVSHADARDLANEIQAPIEFVRNLETGQFVTSVRGLTPRPIVIKVPFGVLEAAPSMDMLAHQRLRALNNTNVAALPRTSDLSSSINNVTKTDTPPDQREDPVPKAADQTCDFAIQPGKTW